MHAHTELRNPIQLPERQIEKFAKNGCFCSRQECARFVHIPSSRHIIYGCSHVDKLMKQFCSAPAVDINFLYEDSFAFPLQASLRSALAVKISMSEKHGLQNSAGVPFKRRAARRAHCKAVRCRIAKSCRSRRFLLRDSARTPSLPSIFLAFLLHLLYNQNCTNEITGTRLSTGRYPPCSSPFP